MNAMEYVMQEHIHYQERQHAHIVQLVNMEVHQDYHHVVLVVQEHLQTQQDHQYVKIV